MQSTMNRALNIAVMGMFLITSAGFADGKLNRPSTDTSLSARSDGFGTEFVSSTIESFPISGIRATDNGLGQGEQILVGPDAGGEFAGKEGLLARLGAFGWDFRSPEPGDQALDSETGELYLYTGKATLFDGLWFDSKWRRLTNEQPKWKTSGMVGSTIAIDETDNGAWYLVSAVDGDFAIKLPNPAQGDFQDMGMELVLEPVDGAIATATLVVQGGGTIMTPDGQIASSFDLPRGTGRAHIYRLVAGNMMSGASWYLVPGL